MTYLKDLIIIGCGGHARVVVDTAISAGFEIQGIIDTDYKGQDEKILGCSVIGSMKLLDELDPEKNSVMVAIGDSSQRAELYYQAKDKGFATPAVIHPTAVVSEHCVIGSGVFINTAVIVNAGAEIGDNTIINTCAIIEHEVIIGKHSHVGPGVRIGGRTKVGEKTFIGIGTSVINFVTIGDNVTIGAGSVIIEQVEPNTTVVGVPGKRIK